MTNQSFSTHFTPLSHFQGFHNSFYVVLQDGWLLDQSGQPNTLDKAKIISHINKSVIKFVEKSNGKLVKVETLVCAITSEFVPIGLIILRDEALALYQKAQVATQALEVALVKFQEVLPIYEFQVVYGETLSELRIKAKDACIRLSPDSNSMFDVMIFPDKLIGVDFDEAVMFVSDYLE